MIKNSTADISDSSLTSSSSGESKNIDFTSNSDAQGEESQWDNGAARVCSINQQNNSMKGNCWLEQQIQEEDSRIIAIFNEVEQERQKSRDSMKYMTLITSSDDEIIENSEGGMGNHTCSIDYLIWVCVDVATCSYYHDG